MLEGAVRQRQGHMTRQVCCFGVALFSHCPPLCYHAQVMSWMEQCAYISASRLRASHILTAAMDSVSFAKSTKVGDILYVTSQARMRQGGCKDARITSQARMPCLLLPCCVKMHAVL
eukprot:scaffold18337_cov33-Tisochrysis_lutea.AAC.2